MTDARAIAEFWLTEPYDTTHGDTRALATAYLAALSRAAAAEAELDDYKGGLQSLIDQLDAMTACKQVADAALRRYGRHEAGCESRFMLAPRFQSRACTCGFDDALSPPAPAGEAADGEYDSAGFREGFRKNARRYVEIFKKATENWPNPPDPTPPPSAGEDTSKLDEAWAEVAELREALMLGAKVCNVCGAVMKASRDTCPECDGKDLRPHPRPSPSSAGVVEAARPLCNFLIYTDHGERYCRTYLPDGLEPVVFALADALAAHDAQEKSADAQAGAQERG